jgi:hypothetical protein
VLHDLVLAALQALADEAGQRDQAALALAAEPLRRRLMAQVMPPVMAGLTAQVLDPPQVPLAVGDLGGGGRGEI